MDGPGVYEMAINDCDAEKGSWGGWGGGRVGETGWMCGGLLEEHSINYQDVVYIIANVLGTFFDEFDKVGISIIVVVRAAAVVIVASIRR